MSYLESKITTGGKSVRVIKQRKTSERRSQAFRVIEIKSLCRVYSSNLTFKTYHSFA